MHLLLNLPQLTPKYTYLKSAYGSTLEAQICFEVLCDFTDKTLEWQLPDQQLGRLLVSSDFSKGHGTWPTRREALQLLIHLAFHT